MKSITALPESVTLSFVLTMINSIFLWKSVDWFLHGVDRPWNMSAYALVLLPFAAVVLGLFMTINSLRQTSRRVVVFAGIVVLILDIIILILE